MKYIPFTFHLFFHEESSPHRLHRGSLNTIYITDIYVAKGIKSFYNLFTRDFALLSGALAYAISNRIRDIAESRRDSITEQFS